MSSAFCSQQKLQGTPQALLGAPGCFVDKQGEAQGFAYGKCCPAACERRPLASSCVAAMTHTGSSGWVIQTLGGGLRAQGRAESRGMTG